MLIKSVSFLPASIKSMNPMQKYPRISELFACTRKTLAIMFLFLTNSNVQHQSYQNKQFHFCYKIKQSESLHIHQGLLGMFHPLFFEKDCF